MPLEARKGELGILQIDIGAEIMIATGERGSGVVKSGLSSVSRYSRSCERLVQEEVTEQSP
jgi:hypothetical protein